MKIARAISLLTCKQCGRFADLPERICGRFSELRDLRRMVNSLKILPIEEAYAFVDVEIYRCEICERDADHTAEIVCFDERILIDVCDSQPFDEEHCNDILRRMSLSMERLVVYSLAENPKTERDRLFVERYRALLEPLLRVSYRRDVVHDLYYR